MKPSRVFVVYASVSLFAATQAQAQSQTPPQCLRSFNGTIGNGTVGSEQQISSTTVRAVNTTDANQGVAVDRDYFYSIDNYSITKHNKTTGRALRQWYGGSDGPIIHLDGGVVINGTLYAPHSNYPTAPETSSVEEWDVTTMEHVRSYSFGINRGSLTWIDQDSTGTWYGTFANYDRVQEGQTQPYGLSMNTQLVRFTPGPEGPFQYISQSWIFPESMVSEVFSPMSNSGGSFGPDGWLYITGHDASAAYVVQIPSAGSVLIWVATADLPDIAGQGIAWDRSLRPEGGNGTLYGISRESRQVVEMNIPLQPCRPQDNLSVGKVLGPNDFVDPDAE
ncbi:uncharacterized protein Z518_05432 [Rhinocladiella mackenziei CBS 650.93]|uniref:Uncharacterized protein n=1 Tax=Rhinocladiella mackenziei CBS 650.93 TaxID=1442369 RepID=A0A0D2FQW4_9EURO|nr:uncharacterized protein Z518_05432 [Rhinocladiella mackenziei CBS 650.93]KIX04562.1 hypothetical protein Z518_05432 [Rhinocladiella mackenziei CBS 650.93]